jgi:predicted dithiol-disulfide oxidoreductase (DUF899 family)
MTSHKMGTHEEWLSARLELLDAEKELTRRGDQLARQRQERARDTAQSVTFTPQQQAGTCEYNFRPMDMRSSLEAGREGPLAEWAATCGAYWPTYAQEAPGMSTFAFEDGVVYHT